MDKHMGPDIGGNEMKIYHTETQADYDSLMVELEEQGAKWRTDTNPTEANNWSEFKRQTGVKVQDCILTYRDVEYFERVNPETPIIKYTAKKEPTEVIWGTGLGTSTLDKYKSIMNAKAHGYDEVPEVETDPNKDMVNQPNHYIGEYGLEVEDVLRNFIPRYTDPYVGHRIASAIEYLLRSPLKNGQQDIEKARKNLEQALGYMEKKELK